MISSSCILFHLLCLQQFLRLFNCLQSCLYFCHYFLTLQIFSRALFIYLSFIVLQYLLFYCTIFYELISIFGVLLDKSTCSCYFWKSIYICFIIIFWWSLFFIFLCTSFCSVFSSSPFLFFLFLSTIIQILTRSLWLNKVKLFCPSFLQIICEAQARVRNSLSMWIWCEKDTRFMCACFLLYCQLKLVALRLLIL